MSDQFLWVEKYRPRRIDDTILPPNLKQAFKAVVESGKLQHMVFTGTSGLGKTTVARALCDELGLDYMVINGSEEGNIDTLRGKIKQFASSVSLSGGLKVVILDEADYLNPQSTQPALRGFIEQFESNCRFIFTCNFKNRLLDAIHSRCVVYEFNTTKKEMAALAAQFFQRVLAILEQEKIEYDKHVVADIITKYAPDWRRVLNALQGAANAKGSITSAATDVAGSSYQELFAALKAKDFKKMRTWVVNNQDVDSSVVYRAIYDQMFQYIQPMSVPQLVLILADYQYKDAFVADHELNMVACLTEVMAGVNFL